MTREIVSTSKQDWATPQWLFDVLHEEYTFTVDLMAAWYNAKLPVFVGPGSPLCEDVFAFSWGEVNGWANPPYAILDRCLQYACAQAMEGSRSTWLVPANTDTRWFHEYAVKGQIDFFKGRISFEDATPALTEAERLLNLIEKKGAAESPKLVRKLGSVLLELSNNDRLEKAVHVVDEFFPTWREEEPGNRRRPGPGFPSMLIHYEPGLPTPEKYRRRSAKTGKLL
jgi:hypothetical protein